MGWENGAKASSTMGRACSGRCPSTCTTASRCISRFANNVSSFYTTTRTTTDFLFRRILARIYYICAIQKHGAARSNFGSCNAFTRLILPYSMNFRHRMLMPSLTSPLMRLWRHLSFDLGSWSSATRVIIITTSYIREGSWTSLPSCSVLYTGLSTGLSMLRLLWSIIHIATPSTKAGKRRNSFKRFKTKRWRMWLNGVSVMHAEREFKANGTIPILQLWSIPILCGCMLAIWTKLCGFDTPTCNSL